MLDDEPRSFITGRDLTMSVITFSLYAGLALADQQRAQLLMVGGFVMLGWVLARRQIAMRKRVNLSTREANRQLKAIREQTEPALPLSDAPVETQRWQVAMFDLQRELKAELDTRIAIVQSLVRHADQRIEQLRQLESADLAGSRYNHCTHPLTTDQLSRLNELLRAGHTSTEIADKLGVAVGDIEIAMAIRR